MSELKKYSIEEFKKYINSLHLSRSIRLIQLHHTYSPGYKQFNGSNHTQLQTGMRNYHIKTNGWSDIGQHFTIFPDGVIMTGRSMEKTPAGIKGANTGAICIECVGNFDRDGDKMTAEQKNAIVSAVKILLERFNLKAADAITYHCWWASNGTKIGDYSKTKSSKTCPGENFFGGNSKAAFEMNLLPLLEESKKINKQDEINGIINILASSCVLSDCNLWRKKCSEDVNVYWLCKKMARYIEDR